MMLNLILRARLHTSVRRPNRDMISQRRGETRLKKVRHGAMMNQWLTRVRIPAFDFRPQAIPHRVSKDFLSLFCTYKSFFFHNFHFSLFFMITNLLGVLRYTSVALFELNHLQFCSRNDFIKNSATDSMFYFVRDFHAHFVNYRKISD